MAKNQGKGKGIGKNVIVYAMIAFILLGVLFGMNIMTFIFGNLGQSQTYTDDSVTITNETGFLNSSGYTVSVASDLSFSGNVAVVTMYNASSGILIDAPNYTVNAATGTITNATSIIYLNTNVTYSYDRKTDARLASEGITNDSLQAVSTYSNQSSTQLSTLSIAITLVILLAVFALFWKFFVGTSKSGGGKRSAGNFS